MRYFLDTEFIEDGDRSPITLLSIGVVCEDGREFYAINNEADTTWANEWVCKNVLPYLDICNDAVLGRATRDEVRECLLDFIGDDSPEFWGYYADYDWVVFCQLFGAMVNLPQGWPMYCRDIKQLCDSAGGPELPAQESKEHNSLNDARWNLAAYAFLENKLGVVQ